MSDLPDDHEAPVAVPLEPEPAESGSALICSDHSLICSDSLCIGSDG